MGNNYFISTSKCKTVNTKCALFLLVMVLASSKCTQENSENIVLNPTNWSTNKFLNFGSPIITSRDKETDIQTEGNFFLYLDDLSNATLHLYGQKYPNDPNYQISIENLTISKCSNQSACKQLEECVNGFIVNEQVAKNLIYVAWSKTNEEIEILVQFENKLLKCSENNDVLNLWRAVLRSSQDQNIAYKTESFLYTTREQKKTVLNDNFTLFNRLLYLEISQCIHCTTLLELECGNYAYNTSVFFNDTEKTVSLGSGIAYLWKEVSLNGPKSDKDCKLTISTNHISDDLQIEPFWALSKRAYTLYESDENYILVDANNNNSTHIARVDQVLMSICILLFVDKMPNFFAAPRRGG